jgi:hypothetical protein
MIFCLFSLNTQTETQALTYLRSRNLEASQPVARENVWTFSITMDATKMFSTQDHIKWNEFPVFLSRAMDKEAKFLDICMKNNFLF